jgi:ABC-type branched-subunit amino acid transport system ATPase component
VDLHMDEGEMVAVLGANGAGKSTLMKSIARVLPLTTGEIVFNGRSAGSLAAYEMTALGLGFVPQERNVFTELTVEENLQAGAYLARRGRGHGLEAAYTRYPLLRERRRQSAGTLSGGERQTLAVACALQMAPKLLILDEPTSGLSPKATESLMRSIIDINEEGVSVLWVVEENPRDVLAHCSRAYFLRAGAVARVDSAQALLKDEGFDGLFLGAEG